ncbi:MAG: alanine--tRNA ligase [Deltaproteobacteria bacterium]|nr:alanine--tRNA ligase [Deltaproteobacteria bacterium]
MSSSPHRTGAQIRREFLDFFGARAHSVQPSSSLVPNDPTLMFVNAGMVQFKDVFTGKEQRDYKRATTSQKCLRVSGKHNDLEEVGRTPRHHTLFEMLGNFSFGDYFKEEAIGYAWTLVKDVWKLDLDKVWVTVHHSDDEAWDLWTRKFGVPEARMQRLGDKDNFWSMGDTGPCGPCTEIHYDLGPSMGDCLKGPAGESDRYMEFWNLVFMQYEQFADGSRQPLANPSVDTGMGLERITGILQGVTTNYETDLIEGLMAVGAEQAKIDMKTADEERMTALRVLADHSRATAFMIADGIIPSNEGRGYVLRRIARRAIRWGVKLGLGANPFFHHVTSAVVDQMGEAFPELREREAFIREVVKGEEVRFGETRDKGLALLDEALAKVSDGTLDGTTVFKLHDTFGFPSDLTALIANEKGIKVDMAGFSEEMEAQRERGRAAWKGSGSAGVDRLWHSLLAEHPTAFTGYTDLDDAARVVALVHDGAKVDTLPDGAEGVVILDRTPFYGESGGQVGDTGTLTAGGVSFAVSDTRKPVPGLHAHHGSARGGALRVGDKVQASVHAVRRNDIRRNHSATHLLHSALREVLGDHVQQRGSLVAGARLRFDFSHHKAVSDAELLRIEDIINREVLTNIGVLTEIMAIDDAKAMGAMSLFGEKYGEVVRVVTIGPSSIELCGGTHVVRAGDIGLVRITSESGVSAGVRRIEAVTGRGSLARVRAHDAALSEASSTLKSSPAELAGAIAKLQADNKALRKQLEDMKRAQALAAADNLSSGAREIGGVKVIAAVSDSPKGLRDQADKLRDELGSGVIVLAAAAGKKAILLVAVTKDLAGKKVHAGNLVRELAAVVGGRGGGRPDFAQAGGSQPDKVGDVVPAAYAALEALLG